MGQRTCLPTILYCTLHILYVTVFCVSNGYETTLLTLFLVNRKSFGVQSEFILNGLETSVFSIYGKANISSDHTWQLECVYEKSDRGYLHFQLKSRESVLNR